LAFTSKPVLEVYDSTILPKEPIAGELHDRGVGVLALDGDIDIVGVKILGARRGWTQGF